MSGAAAVLELVTAVNAVLTLTTQIGISHQKLAQAQQQAALEGREFTVDDVRAIAGDAQEALDRLQRAIDEASVPKPLPG